MVGEVVNIRGAQPSTGKGASAGVSSRVLRGLRGAPLDFPSDLSL